MKTDSKTDSKYVLFSVTEDDGAWRFVLRTPAGVTVTDASDVEPDTRGARLELLTVIRGLEALDQPSQVTLVTTSRYVRRGIGYGLKAWRISGWRWEAFGRLVPVKNDDLWQRLDRALAIHQVRMPGCRPLAEPASEAAALPHRATPRRRCDRSHLECQRSPHWRRPRTAAEGRAQPQQLSFA